MSSFYFSWAESTTVSRDLTLRLIYSNWIRKDCSTSTIL